MSSPTRRGRAAFVPPGGFFPPPPPPGRQLPTCPREPCCGGNARAVPEYTARFPPPPRLHPSPQQPACGGGRGAGAGQTPHTKNLDELTASGPGLGEAGSDDQVKIWLLLRLMAFFPKRNAPAAKPRQPQPRGWPPLLAGAAALRAADGHLRRNNQSSRGGVPRRRRQPPPRSVATRAAVPSAVEAGRPPQPRDAQHDSGRAVDGAQKPAGQYPHWRSLPTA